MNVAPQSARKRSKRKAIIIGAISAILIATLIAGMLVLGNVFKTGKQSTPNSSTTSSSHSNTSDAQQMGKNGTNDSNQFNGSANGQTTDGDSTDNTQSDTTENPLKITESGWSADSAGYIHYAVAVKNTSSTLQVEFLRLASPGARKTARYCSLRITSGQYRSRSRPYILSDKLAMAPEAKLRKVWNSP